MAMCEGPRQEWIDENGDGHIRFESGLDVVYKSDIRTHGMDPEVRRECEELGFPLLPDKYVYGRCWLKPFWRRKPS